MARATPTAASTPRCSSSIAGRSRNGPSSYLEHHANTTATWSKLDEPLAPAHFEFRFGPPRAGRRQRPRTRVRPTKPFALDIGGEKIRVTGRIDRIDVGHVGGKTVFNVIDYKSGQKASAEAGTDRIRRTTAAADLRRGRPGAVFDRRQPRRSAPATGRWQAASTPRALLAVNARDDMQPSDDWEELRSSESRSAIGQFVARHPPRRLSRRQPRRHIAPATAISTPSAASPKSAAWAKQWFA